MLKPLLKEGYVLFEFGNKQIADEFSENIFVEEDPGILDREKLDFYFTDKSLPEKINFKAIPYKKIGLFDDEYRKNLPSK